MKFLASFFLALLLGYLVYVFNDVLPWWGIAIAALIAGVAVPLKPWASWLSGFLGITCLWGILAWWLDKENAGVMSARMAEVLPFGGNTNLLLFATAVVGGIVGGFGALTGSFLRKRIGQS